MSDYLSISEVAHELKVSNKTVRRWIATGQLPAERLGARLIRIRRDDLDQLTRRIPTMKGGAA
jgi:excisionase family DNA binding protein